MRPTRHLAAAATVVALLGTGASAAWAQTADEGDGLPELQHVEEETPTWQVVVEKRWERADGEWLGGPPLDISADWAITVSSDLETVTCTTGLGGLACNDGGDGVSVAAGGSYTVSESGLPAGFAPHSGVGTFATTAEAPGEACVPAGAESLLCTHTVVNRATSATVPGDPEAPYPDDPVEEPADPPADDEASDPVGTEATPTIGDISSTTDSLPVPAPAETSPVTTAVPILPVTGGSPDALLAMGTALVATGFGAVAGSRRRNR